MRALLAILLLLAAQDEAKIRELIQSLDDDRFEVREKAEKDLTALGPPALPYLKAAAAEAERQKDRAEIKVRALSAIRAIEFAAKSKQVYTDPRLVTIKAEDWDLARVLEDLEKQSGVKIDGASVDAKAKVSLSAENAPLFKVLD